MSDPLKRCTTCGEMKPLSEFYKNKKHKDGLRYECKQCTNKSNKFYRDKYPEKKKEKSRARHLKYKFNFTEADYLQFLEKQNFKCAICGIDYTLYKTNRNMEFCIDHNHRTNEIRGLLCDSCNRGIGHLQDNPAILRKAADYLEERGNYA